jgi:hypothetical protein
VSEKSSWLIAGAKQMECVEAGKLEGFKGEKIRKSEDQKVRSWEAGKK